MKSLRLFNENYNFTVDGANDIYINDNMFLPVGSICIYSGETAPNGWLLCNGSAISRTTYSRLFSVINTLYGSGDGTTTFNIPNLEERIPVGKTNSTNLGSSGGNNTITLATNQLPSHTHTGTTVSNGSHSHTGTTDSNGSHSHSINDPGHAHSQWTNQDDFNEYGGNPPSFADDNGSIYTWNNINSNTTGITINAGGAHTHTFTSNLSSDHNHTFTTDSTGSGSAIDIRNKFIVMNYIIRY
jgi:microcystin-dependent protein